MKMRFFTLLALVFIGSEVSFAQDSIPNGGFERWTVGGANFSDPNGWRTPDPFTSPLPAIVVSADSATSHTGRYCAKLTTKSGAGFTIPGLVSTGYINPSTQNIEAGILIHSRPTAVLGWYQFTPSTSDTASISIN